MPAAWLGCAKRDPFDAIFGMRVIVATTFVPFVNGGANLLAEWLGKILEERGHQVEILRFPFSPRCEELLEQLLALRLIDVTQHGDRVIAIRPPAYLIKHPDKVVWFIHHHRGAYDLWSTPYQDLPSTPEGLRWRDSIRSGDNVALGEARHLYCNSKLMAARLAQYNQVQAEVLYPPLYRPERYRAGQYGDYLLYISRLTHHKRQWLALEALRCTQTPVRLVITGAADPSSRAYVAELKFRMEKHGLTDRVTLIDRWISEEEKISLFADCLAAVYMPFNEDSYGYPSLEAHSAGKAVITTVDAGGPLELIQDGVNGIVTASEPGAIATAMDQLYADRALAKRMGEAGQQRITDLDITWDHVVEKLLS